MTLKNLNAGDVAKVLKITASGSDRQRFYDMGIIPSTEAECVLRHKRGEIAAYKIRGAIIALRFEDSEKIIISGRGRKCKNTL